MAPTHGRIRPRPGSGDTHKRWRFTRRLERSFRVDKPASVSPEQVQVARRKPPFRSTLDFELRIPHGISGLQARRSTLCPTNVARLHPIGFGHVERPELQVQRAAHDFDCNVALTGNGVMECRTKQYMFAIVPTGTLSRCYITPSSWGEPWITPTAPLWRAQAKGG